MFLGLFNKRTGGVDNFQFLADRFGEEKLGELARRTAGRLPYMASPAFRQIFGRGLGDLWGDFQDTLVGSAAGETDCEAAVVPGRRVRERV